MVVVAAAAAAAAAAVVKIVYNKNDNPRRNCNEPATITRNNETDTSNNDKLLQKTRTEINRNDDYHMIQIR